jgi:hypothetical protein
MLGNKLWEGGGRTVGTRVLPGDDFRYVKLEVSIEGPGKLLGMDATNMGTFTAFERVPGQMYAEGQGIIMTADGESAIWEWPWRRTPKRRRHGCLDSLLDRDSSEPDRQVGVAEQCARRW